MKDNTRVVKMKKNFSLYEISKSLIPDMMRNKFTNFYGSTLYEESSKNATSIRYYTKKDYTYSTTMSVYSKYMIYSNNHTDLYNISFRFCEKNDIFLGFTQIVTEIQGALKNNKSYDYEILYHDDFLL